MSQIVLPYWKNALPLYRVAPGDVAWHEIPWTTYPNLDMGIFLTALSIKAITSTDTDGSPMEIMFNQASAPVNGFVINPTHPFVFEPISYYGNMWYKLGATTDLLELWGWY